MSDNIKVVVKVRPLISREIEDKLCYQWRVNNNTLYQLDQNGKGLGVAFTFDKVYDKDTKTSDVYNDIAKPIVEAATAGINGTIFAYGQTSSGKTYTMTGTEDSPGIIQMAVLNLFDIIKNIPNRDFLVRVSYLEIYNETLKDLLDLERENLKIHESLQGIKVDASEKVVSSPDEVLEAMKQGEANRHTGATNMNEMSSRSHTIFQITIESRDHVEGEEEAGCVNVSQLNLVDLAGSERAGQTGAKGIRFKEGTLINKSLSALALVIKQLAEDSNKYTNYRDSKLTRILQNSLGGNAKTSIICAVTPAAVEETVSTLQFANRAKAIKNTPEVNAVTNEATMIQTLTKQLSKLQEQLKKKKNLEVILASKKNVEQANYNLQKQIAALQKLIINAFDQRSSVDVVTTRRKNPPRRFTISNLHAIEEDVIPDVPKFCTPVLKYNPMYIPGVSEFAPIQEPRNLTSLPEELYRSVTPPLRKKKVDFDDEVIVLDSDDESSAQTCSPYHKCYDTKTPPCILRKNAQAAEKNFRDIVELTEREKIYSPEVHELMDKLEDCNKVIIKLKDDIEELTEKSRIKDTEINQLKDKVKESEEEIKNITDIKTNLEGQCNNYNMKLTDCEFSYETLKKKAKRREEELLSLLNEQNVKKADCAGNLSKNVEREYENLMDISKESLINSSNESSSNEHDEEYSSVNVKNIISDLQAQLHFKDQTILELETNFSTQRERIEFLEKSSHELQTKINTFKEKLTNVENENSILKITIDTLNSAIGSQRNNLEIVHKDVEGMDELQIKLTNKDSITNVNLNETLLDALMANDENFFTNNENIKNLVYSFKAILDKRNQETTDLKASNVIHLQDIENKTKCIENLTEEIQKLQDQVKENVATINKLLTEKNNLITLEQDLTRDLDTAQKLNNDLKIINEKNLKEIAALKENNELMLLQKINNEAEEQKMLSLNDQLGQRINDMTKQITNLEEDNKQKEEIISKLKTEDATSQEHLRSANLALGKLKNVIRMLTGDIEDIPEVFDNFVNIFKILCNGLSVLESSAANIMSHKEEAVKDLIELQKKYDEMCNMHSDKIKNLLTQIDKFQESEKSLTIINENISQQLKELTLEIDSSKSYIETITNENSTLQTQLSNLKDEISCLKDSLVSKEKTISALKDNEAKLLSTMEKQISHTEKTNMEQDIKNLTATLETKEEMFKNALQLKEETISELSSNLKLMEGSVNDKCSEIITLHERLSVVLNEKDNTLKNVLEKLSFLSNNLNLSNLSADEVKDRDTTEIIMLKLNKIIDYIVQTRNVNSPRCNNYDDILSETQKQVKELNTQNINLINKLSLIKENNLQLMNEIHTIQRDNVGLSGDLTTGNTLLEHLQHELKLKYDELSQMVEKVADWKDQFMTLDTTMKKHMDDLKLENENIKMRFIELKNNTEEEIKLLTENSLEDYSSKNDVKISESIIETKYSPKSLLTLCCSTIVDYIQPRNSELEDVTYTQSNTETELLRATTPEKQCICDHLSNQLSMIQNEKIELTNTINQLKLTNSKLKDELEEVSIEVQLLLEPIYELQKRIIGHRTNLSILTATTYAENKSLISQVKGLQHHHSRFHNVCQRDIPAFKRQLCELLAILKDNGLTSTAQNANLKRYSLPDVLDNKNTPQKLRNESTHDGDLLMLDTNVTLTTADNTLVGYDQTCLDLTQTLYSEVSCQTNEMKLTSELESQMNVLSNDNENMINLLEILKEENIKLRERVDMFSKEKVDIANISLIEREKTQFDNICKKCKDLDKFKIELKSMEAEHKDVSEKLSEVTKQKDDFERKYSDLKLEVSNSDALVQRLDYLQKDCNTKSNEIIKLTATLKSKCEQLQFLQEENISLSTQVMENISETDDLSKELNNLKQQNVELTEKCNILEKEKHKYNDIKCTQCDIKDNTIFTLQAKSISGSRTKQKLNRSYSDSDTSSRFNKICTLQSELYAGQEDCKELSENFTTIKNHLERSNMSMDLDDSMGETSNSHSIEYLPKSPQMNTCIMPDIPEEHLFDDYITEKKECLNYFVEKTGNKTVMDSKVKILDLMKMFYDNVVAKHGNDIENLSNKLKNYESSYSELQIKMSNITCDNEKITNELKEKKKDSDNLANVILQLKNNIIIITEESEKLIEPDKNERVVNLFKDKLLRMIDTEFGLSTLNLFSFIDNIINKHDCELNEASHKYNNTQEQLLKVTSELASACDDLTKLKSQLNEKENEYKLLKAQKEKIYEISNAVTLDIIKKEKLLNEIVSKHFQTLVKLNIIDSKAIDTELYSNNKVDFLLEHLTTLLNQRAAEHEDREKLNQELQHLKTILDCKEKLTDNLKAHKEELLETIDKANVTLTTERNKYQELNTLHEELNKVYNSKVEENNVNSNLVEKLTEEIDILKKNIIQHEATINSLSEKEHTISNLITKIKELQEDNNRLKSANEFINKEKEAYALELEVSNKTIKQNNIELDRMTSDILVLRESIKENTSIIDTLKDEAKSLLKQNLELREQLEVKCQDCTRLERNIKTHEKTAHIQNKIITRFGKEKEELDLLIGQKDKQLEEINAKYMILQNNYEEMSKTKESLEVRISELESGEHSTHKARTSIDRIVESARRRRQSLHDSKRIFADEESNNLMDVDDDSNRSTPIRLSKGRDSLQSRTDQSERDEEHSSRPGSVQATRKRRQSSHDLHRSVIQTPPSFDHPSPKFVDELSVSKNSELSNNNDANVLRLKEKLASCLEELEDLKEKYKELDEECETCAEYLHEREDQCIRLKEEKAALEAQLQELREKMHSSNVLNQNECKCDVAHVAVNTDEDWTKLHTVVVDRMSYDAEVDKNKRLVKVIEDLRYSKQDLQNTLAKMQRALEKHSEKDNRELEAIKMELQQRTEELEELRQRYKELDEECETCAEYLKEREEQCYRLKEANAALEAKIQDIQDESVTVTRVQSTRKKRQAAHDRNRDSSIDFIDASTQIGDDFLSNQVDRDDSRRAETPSRELRRLKKAVDVLTQQKAALESQLTSLSTIPATCPTMYVATGSAIVQNQQWSDAMRENQKLKKINAKLLNICKKRGKCEANRENEDPSDQG